MVTFTLADAVEKFHIALRLVVALVAGFW